ncbi:Ras-related protein Rab-3D [Strongyloides ratti]|uniref:Ras-related protein Rab-3 n=1 Tax=Strongyloides ratti TaxID=34506 RepID=A0A090LNS9_STRRB|nr:Ras-related protein Rab-3D [Strongyloides ratti]CEF71421.1 Ras-related protein Rab-3D [Strongyloides ratti]
MEKKQLYGRVKDIVKTKTNKNNFQIKDNKEIVVHNIANNFTGNAINTFGVSLYLISTGESQNVENANNTKEEKGNIDVPINTSKPLISLSERIDFLFDQVINNDNNIKSFHQISLPAHMIMAHTNAVAASGSGTPATGGQGDNSFDYMFKLLIIGNSSVGKTSFLFRYCDDSFTSAFVSTVGIDFKVKQVVKGDKKVKLQIWDTAGQERYRTITTAYYRGAMGFILMYDITNEESFNSVQDWCTQIKTYSWENAQVVLVGNKCDMEMERVVSTERGRQLADQLGLEFFETSAKTSQNVKNVFDKLVEIICNKMAESLDKNPNQNSEKGIKVDQPATQKASGQQCNC